MAGIFTCSCCRRVLPANPRIRNQQYCGEKKCQRARKRKWQSLKMATDSDYRDNQRAAYKDWRSRNPDYWRERRRNQRAGGRHPPKDASVCRPVKMDTSSRNLFVIPGEYIITPIGGQSRKMDALRVKIIAVAGG